jgi:peptide/nickel transport system substrate-binding protein
MKGGARGRRGNHRLTFFGAPTLRAQQFSKGEEPMKLCWTCLLILTLVLPTLSACTPATPVAAPAEAPKPIVQTVIVEKPVEKETVKTVVVEKQVEKLVFVTPTPEPTPSKPTTGGTVRLTWNEPYNALDIHGPGGPPLYTVGQFMWEKLVDWDPNLNVVPMLAEKWDVSADGLTYTLNLRKGVKFNNGKDLTAEDVVYSLQRNADPKTGASAGYLRRMDTVEAVDPSTVRIKLKEPYADFLAMLGWFRYVIYPKGHVPSDKDGFIGTGPFMIKSYIPQEQLILVKNPYYWRQGMPYVDRVEFNVIRDDMARINALMSGQTDFAWWVPPLSLVGFKDNPQYTIFVGPAQIHKGISINSTRAPFNNPLVREALDNALNRKAFIDVALQGYGSAITGDPQLPGAWAYYDKQFVAPEGDLKKAKALLTQAGLADGFSTYICTYGTQAADVQAAQIFQASLKELNVKLEIRNVDPGVWVDKVYKGECDMAFQGLRSFNPDMYLRETVHPTDAIIKNVWNNQTVAKMIEDTAKELDKDKRKKLYATTLDALHATGQDTYTVFLELWRDTQRVVVSNRLHGFYSDGTGTLRALNQVWMSK